jgi:hypothetical protein
MADKSNRLVKGSITLAELIQISYDAYKQIDNKELRSGLDIKNARLTRRRNFSYNRSTKDWEQTGRDVRLDFLVHSRPISYKTNSKIKDRFYPITFLIHDVSKGINSPVKLREGSNYKPKFTKPGMSKQQRENIENWNIKAGVQLQAFFDSHWVYKQYGILFGPCYANGAPLKRNPKLLPFLSKHSWFICKTILIPLLGRSGLRLQEIWRNE